VKAIVREADTAEANAILDAVSEPFACFSKDEIGIPNAIRLKRFRGEITMTQETAALHVFKGEVDAGRFARIAYDLGTEFVGAEQLSARYARRARHPQP